MGRCACWVPAGRRVRSSTASSRREATRYAFSTGRASRAEQLAEEFGPRVKVFDWANRSDGAREACVLVNTTSAGLKGAGTLGMDFAGFNEDCVVSDIVYVPLETELLAQARAHGLRTVDGLGMLLHQAVPGFEKWFGVRPQVTDKLRDHPHCRHRGPHMLIVGLTGSIGMGKSTAAAHLQARGLPVFDADAEVHRLYAGGKAVELVERAFPGTTASGAIDRAKLSAVLLAQPQRFTELEAIVHPLVRDAERSFLRDAKEHGAKIAVLEIPLLFETGADELVDVSVVVSANPEVQRERLLKRPGLTKDKLDKLLARQLPDAEKRRRADFVVDTSADVEASRAALDAIIAALRGRHAEAYARHWA